VHIGRGAALDLVRILGVEQPSALGPLRGRAPALEPLQIELAPQRRRMHRPERMEVIGLDVVVELRLLARLGDALALVEAVEPIRDDHVPERHLAAHSRADPAHRDARGIQLAEERAAAQSGRDPAHPPEPRGRDLDRALAALAPEAATVVGEAGEIRAPAPARAEGEHGLQLVIEGREDEHVHRGVVDAGARHVVPGWVLLCEALHIGCCHGRLATILSQRALLAYPS
jgi:hypothetical protein